LGFVKHNAFTATATPLLTAKEPYFMKRLPFALFLSCILLSFAALAEPSPLKPQTQGEVAFVSGGVGDDEQSAMQAMRADYNLSLLFSLKGTGEYVSEVTVRITDASGKACLETVSYGPMLLAQIKPGRYIVSVDLGGQAIHRSVTVRGKKRTALSFAWLQEQKG
jgi:hypothetical protein